MKTSRYNWLVEHDGDTIAYNGLTGAMAVLEEQNIPAISDVINTDGNVDHLLQRMDDSLVIALKHGRFVVEDDLDERTLLRIAFHSSKYSSPKTYGGYTLVMTRKCNFRCTYCFEHDTLAKGDSITTSVLDQVIKCADEFNGEFFSITLYGGEPLLEYDKCIYVSSRCKEAVEKNGAKFGAGMISNGYLLTPERVKKLKEAGLTHIQVTIDGSKETHNANRPLANGKGTYDRIIRNIKECAGIIQLHIRMNIKKANINEINEVKGIIAPLPLTDVHVAIVDLSCQGNDQFYRKVQENVSDILPVEQMALRHLHSIIGGCAANSVRPSVVLPNGKLVRCWEHLDDYDSGCSIFDDPVQDDLATLSKWVGWDPYIPSSNCYECRYLPGCGGGCSRNTIMNWGTKCLYTSDNEYKKSIIGSYISLKTKKTAERGNKGESNDIYQ